LFGSGNPNENDDGCLGCLFGVVHPPLYTLYPNNQLIS
jgi:hypothetical protein